ncbi:MAG: beta-N-acetylhexosaminidase [Gemmatimonadaceae bacterium]
MNRRLFPLAACVMLGVACRPAAHTAPSPSAGVSPVIQPPRLIPAPASMVVGTGAPFAITAATPIVVDGGSAEAAQVGEALGMLLRPATGYPLPVTTTGTPAAGTAAPPAPSPNKVATASAVPTGPIHLVLAADRSSLGEEGYELTVTADSVRIVALRPAGLFHGVQTLRQLLPYKIESEMDIERPSWNIPAVTISDQPRFVWRGAMLDVARHFFTVKEVEQFIDILALYKMNMLHLHLADDQGWRIVIDSRPRLTAVGSVSQVGGGPGGFYTQEDYSEIVRYAAARYITVVPEIDMPAHSNAAISAYPEVGCSARPAGTYTGTDVGWSALCVDSAATYALVDDIIREISALTPGPYFHIGGDEVATLTPAQYTKFVEHVQDIVTKHGKKMVGWEEITKARLLPTSVAQQWKSDSATAALQYGSKLVMSPSEKIYLDMQYEPSTELGLHWAAYVKLSDAYNWDPATYMKGVGESTILGVEAPLWSETIANITAAEYLLMPRLPAVAEIGWTPQAGRDWNSFRTRIAAHASRWNQLGINWYRSPEVAW